MSTSNSEDPAIGSNQDDPFEHFHASVKADQELKRLAVRKSYDLHVEPEELKIANTRNYNSYHGDSPIVSMVKAALLAAGIGTAGWFVMPPPLPDAEQVTPVEDTNTRYELRFDD